MILDILIFVFIGIGLFFNLLAGIGLLRFPDVYTRLHAGTKCTTFGSIFLIGSVVLIGLNLWWENDTNGSVLAIHSAAALIAILLTNPVGAHAIARAAHRSGVQPVGAVIDELAEKPGKTTSDSQTGGD
ncbi:MAG: monovalent cation/H(+) antiporter subunit G [Euryarchaeota archaeon]|jgi:multicomponent Na+:H+ antiporter subunit G|nr:monovalent cation/H(+) antiporter subunit G [Euryarchaeota archaeon]